MRTALDGSDLNWRCRKEARFISHAHHHKNNTRVHTRPRRYFNYTSRQRNTIVRPTAPFGWPMIYVALCQWSNSPRKVWWAINCDELWLITHSVADIFLCKGQQYADHYEAPGVRKCIRVSWQRHSIWFCSHALGSIGGKEDVSETSEVTAPSTIIAVRGIVYHICLHWHTLDRNW